MIGVHVKRNAGKSLTATVTCQSMNDTIMLQTPPAIILMTLSTFLTRSVTRVVPWRCLDILPMLTP